MKANPAEFGAQRDRYLNSDLRRRYAAVWHQTFSASLINGGTIPIRHHDAESLPAGGDRGRQASRSTTNYEYICIEHLARTNEATDGWGQ
jgi:hypothetical protein